MAEGANMICPKCQSFQHRALNCTSCGVIVAKVQPAASADEAPVRSVRSGNDRSSSFEVRAFIKPVAIVSVVVVVAIWAPGFVSDFIHADERRLEEALQELPFYPVLAEYEPKAYEQIKTTVMTAYKRGQTPQQAVAQAREVAVKTLVKYLPRASDDAVREFGFVMLDELDQLTDHPDACYRFLFPKSPAKRGSADPVSYIDEDTRMADLEASAEVLRSAKEDPQSAPAAAEGEALIAEQGELLYSRYGDALVLLSQRTHRDEDKATLCRMYFSMMNNIMKMPQQKSSKVLRYLLALQA